MGDSFCVLSCHFEAALDEFTKMLARLESFETGIKVSRRLHIQMAEDAAGILIVSRLSAQNHGGGRVPELMRRNPDAGFLQHALRDRSAGMS